jgi:hypothetical protein
VNFSLKEVTNFSSKLDGLEPCSLKANYVIIEAIKKNKAKSQQFLRKSSLVHTK